MNWIDNRLSERFMTLKIKRWVSTSVAGTLLAVAGLCFGVTGCVSVPPVGAGAKTTAEELAAHVKFLSQLELKGRQPKTRGSRVARHYIESRFKAYGLVPWSREKGYALPFGYGENVVGVLPGSDTNLAPEIVLLSAHYDHFGKDKRGRIYPGAVDNASGVAVLLETAKWMSSPGHKPKRTVGFAAFDCEEQMLLGSFAFTCRRDVAEAKIVATVNLDMLGRDLLDVVRNTVFVAGTEFCPALREQVCRLGTNAGIRVLPIGADFIGPVSDHVAFESREIPCLFFSCGICRDYHKPTDTADKLDYPELERSAGVVRETVEELAEGANLARGPMGNDYDPEELRTVSTVLSEINRGSEQAGIKQEDREKLQKLEATAEDLLHNHRYDRETREQFIITATGTLVPYLLPFEEASKNGNGEQQKESVMFLQYLQHFYLNYHREIMEGYRKLVAQVLKYRPGAFRGMPSFEHEVYDIPDADISLKVLENDTYALNALVTRLILKADVKSSKWLVNSFQMGIFGTFENIDGEGTREQLADLCLLRLRAEQTNQLHTEKIKKVLRAVTGTEPEGNYADLLAERLERGGYQEETEWIVSCMASGNPALALAGTEVAKGNPDARLHAAACKLVLDRSLRSDVRAGAMDLMLKKRDRNTLLVLCDVLEDASPAYKLEYTPMFTKDYPFSERMAVKTVTPLLESQSKHSPRASVTIGDLAREGLKQATKKDFGKDARRWQTWVEGHVS